MPTLDEVLLGLGSGAVTFDYYPDLADDLADYRHLIFYRHGRPFGAVVILDRTPSREGIIVSGLGLGWWLSVDNEGSIIESREFIAGNDQLDNGGFELLDALAFPLWWTVKEGSAWSPYTADVHAGARAIRTTADVGKDDVLTSSQPRELAAGALVRASCWAKRPTGAIGRLRLRTVYEGRFDPPNLLAGVTWADVSDFPGDADVVGSTLVGGPCTRPQVITNPSFEAGFTGWDVISGSGVSIASGEGYGGGDALQIQDYAGGTSLENDYDPGTPGDQVFPVRAGEKWQFEVDMWADGADGHCEYRVFPGVSAPIAVLAFESDSGGYKHEQKLVEITSEMAPTGTEALILTLTQYLSTTGRFLIDNVTATRVAGNTAVIEGDPVAVTPEKAYRVLVPVTADAGCTAGDVRVKVLLQGAGRSEQTVVSGTIDYQQKARTLLSFDFTPPSGYDTATVSLVWTDVLGGPIVANERPTLELTDTTTAVVDAVIGPAAGGWTEVTADSTAPAGTEKVHLEVVAEANGDGWIVDDVNWHRREPIDAPAAVLDEFLRDPDTGEYLVEPGVIHALGALGWDWLLTNEPARNAVLELLTGGRLAPTRELRHNPNNTIDVGLPDELFEVRPITFTEPDLLLLSPFEVKLAVEDRLTREKLIGAKLQRPAPLPDAVITGSYETTIDGALDWFGRPVRRTKVVSDPGVTFQAHAAARAQDDVEASAAGADSITVDIAEWGAWGELNVGDWCGAYKPEALWQDPDNPQTDTRTGRRIFPRLSRVLDRKLTMARGDGFAVKVRRADGTELDVSDFVRWADKTTARLTLGDERIDLTNDPQGPAAGVRYVRDRAREVR